jgi:3-hydroxy-9,10-secoandrosta-1,3,5(10)-triene-9,17-dione monooxygenase
VSDVLKRIEQVAGRLADQADEADQAGQLGAETVRLLREVGVIRLLQPREFGGYESHPN